MCPLGSISCDTPACICMRVCVFVHVYMYLCTVCMLVHTQLFIHVCMLVHMARMHF